MSIKIEKKVAAPLPNHRKYPFAEMVVGDSFEIKGDPYRMQATISSAAWGYCCRHSKQKNLLRTKQKMALASGASNEL